MTDSIAKLLDDRSALYEQRRPVQADIDAAREAHGLPIETINARIASLPKINAEIAVVEAELAAARRPV
jgi:hypothetical protein